MSGGARIELTIFLTEDERIRPGPIPYEFLHDWTPTPALLDSATKFVEGQDKEDRLKDERNDPGQM